MVLRHSGAAALRARPDGSRAQLPAALRDRQPDRHPRDRHRRNGRARRAGPDPQRRRHAGDRTHDRQRLPGICRHGTLGVHLLCPGTVRRAAVPAPAAAVAEGPAADALAGPDVPARDRGRPCPVPGRRTDPCRRMGPSPEPDDVVAEALRRRRRQHLDLERPDQRRDGPARGLPRAGGVAGARRRAAGAARARARRRGRVDADRAVRDGGADRLHPGLVAAAPASGLRLGPAGAAHRRGGTAGAARARRRVAAASGAAADTDGSPGGLGAGHG